MKSAFITVIGRTNVGKSSFINNVVGSKVSIVTNKVQTTRDIIYGIRNDEDSQLVFVDTPGIHDFKIQNELSKKMNKSATKSIKDVDAILMLSPVNEKISQNDLKILKILNKTNIIKYLLITKIDLVLKEKIYEKIDEWTKLENNFLDIIPISTKKNLNIDVVIDKLKNNAAEQDFLYFPNNEISNKDVVFNIKEVIREQLLNKLNEEVPHSLAIVVDSYEDKKDICVVYATIYCEKQSQKKIIIGSNGNKIKEISINSRKEIELMLNKKVFLQVFVKVSENWKRSISIVEKLGY